MENPKHVFIDMGDKWLVKNELEEGDYMVHDTSLKVEGDSYTFVHRVRKIGTGVIGQ